MKMQTMLSLRWRAVLAAAVLVAGAAALFAPPHQTAQAQDNPLTIFAIGFVDVAGGDDPNCPGCDGEFGEEDEDFATNNPLPELEFIVKDQGGTEIASGFTEPLANLQRAQIEVPELLDGEEYTLELVSPPNGWQLCPNESASRTLTIDDFQLGSTREDFHFWMGCQAQATPTTPGEEPTVTPPSGATPKATSKPGDDDDDDDDEHRATTERLGSIKGLVFTDQNQDGSLGPSEPGMSGVGVHLRGGGLDLYQVSSSTGQFSFDGLGAGEYDVFVQTGPEWKITTPALYKVKVNGDTVMGIDFGLVRTGAEPAKAHRGMRLPPTGVADLPTSGLLGAIAAVLGAVAVVGYTFERRRARP
ncbi:MAG: hypothetical protein DYG90_01840 [Chloroflexi bacterium CFX6]|nr:hypothetical protein [Chloroflexi bacterium CFX6]